MTAVCWPGARICIVRRLLPCRLPLLGALCLTLGACSSLGPNVTLDALTPACRLPPPEQAKQGPALAVLQNTFKRLRTGQPLDVTAATSARKVGASPDLLDYQALRIDTDMSGGPSASRGRLPARPSAMLEQLLNARQAMQPTSDAGEQTPRPARNVEEELSRRIPWLDDWLRPKSTDKAELQQAESANSTELRQAADDGLRLIQYLHDKTTPLLRVDRTREKVNFSKSELPRLQPSLQKLAVLEPFHLVTLVTARRIVEILPNDARSQATESQELDNLVYLFNAAVFLSEYYDQYFRGYQLVQVSVPAKRLEDDVVAQLNGRLDSPLDSRQEARLRSTLASICAEADKCSKLLTLGSPGLVTLFGESLQFAGVSVAWPSDDAKHPWKPAISKPTKAEFGAQLVQVAVEAVFDANGPHPAAVPGATACTRHLFKPEDQERDPCTPDADASWARANLVGNRTEAIVTTGAGIALRGVNVAALSNETAATVLETFVGVTARKAVQKVYARCNSAPLLEVEHGGMHD